MSQPSLDLEKARHLVEEIAQRLERLVAGDAALHAADRSQIDELNAITRHLEHVHEVAMGAVNDFEALQSELSAEHAAKLKSIFGRLVAPLANTERIIGTECARYARFSLMQGELRQQQTELLALMQRLVEVTPGATKSIQTRKAAKAAHDGNPKSVAMVSIEREFRQWQAGKARFANDSAFARHMHLKYAHVLTSEASIANAVRRWRKQAKADKP